MRVWLFPPSKRGTNWLPWVVVETPNGLFCNCPGFKWRNKCHHLTEIEAGRDAVRGLDATDRARIIEMLQTDEDHVMEVAQAAFPSADDFELKAYIDVLNNAFMENEENIA